MPPAPPFVFHVSSSRTVQPNYFPHTIFYFATNQAQVPSVQLTYLFLLSTCTITHTPDHHPFPTSLKHFKLHNHSTNTGGSHIPGAIPTNVTLTGRGGEGRGGPTHYWYDTSKCRPHGDVQLTSAGGRGCALSWRCVLNLAASRGCVPQMCPPPIYHPLN